MSYGAPWEQDVGGADPTLLLSLEGSGLAPGASGSNRGAKKALKVRYQRKKRRRLREEAAARKMRCMKDQDSCMGMMAEMIEENRQGMVYISRAVDQCETTFCSDLEKMRSEVRKEMAKERSNMLVMMSSLTKLWKLFAAKGACSDAAIGAVFGDCGTEVDVIDECWSAEEQQEREDTGDRGASSRYVVQDVAAGNIGDAASVGEAVPCESGVDVGRPSVDGSGEDGMDEQDVGASLAFGISYDAVQGPAGEGEGLGGTNGYGGDVAVQDRLRLILKRDSDDEESDDEADDCWGVGVDVCGMDQEQHRFVGWGELCAQERSVFAGAVAVRSGADVVDRQIVARGDVSVDGGEIGSSAADVQDDQARIEGLGSGGTDGAASGIQGQSSRPSSELMWVGRMSMYRRTAARSGCSRRVCELIGTGLMMWASAKPTVRQAAFGGQSSGLGSELMWAGHVWRNICVGP